MRWVGECMRVSQVDWAVFITGLISGKYRRTMRKKRQILDVFEIRNLQLK